MRKIERIRGRGVRTGLRRKLATKQMKTLTSEVGRVSKR